VTTLPAGTIRIKGVGKRYTKYEDTPTLAYGMMRALRGGGHRGKLWAVRDLDVDVAPGEALGVIGRNGSGKSTLLQMLCGVTGPTTGDVRVAGRVAPLISVGVGFHPELTGRENIFVNGAILGLSRREIMSRVDEIIAFSEIESFIDTPVKFYSSGMFVRLGFSVAAHVEPDVLLLDEVLAVGDLGFQMKCYRHIASLRETGCTVVLVSHNMAALERHCTRGIVLDRGSKIFDGDAPEAVAAYHKATQKRDQLDSEVVGQVGSEPDAVEVLKVETLKADGSETNRFDSGETLTVQLCVRSRKPINAPYVLVRLYSDQGVLVYQESNLFRPFAPLQVGVETALTASMKLDVTTGAYTVEVWFGRGNQDSRDQHDVASGAANLMAPVRMPIYVKGRDGTRGLADLHASFESRREDVRRAGS
jgi:ABC-type polysaccharide/polyol phosphate transport system ATPase subunit